jgi:integrase
MIPGVFWNLGKSRRTLRNIVRTYSPEEIYQLITARSWAYRTWSPFYHTRDRALLSLLFLTAGRVGEVLSLRKSQFDRASDPEFIIIRNMLTEKIGPKSANLPYREEFPIPRSGRLQPFTELVEAYLDLMEEYHIRDERLFPFSRVRAWQIVEHITGKWPHWFRAQAERMYGKKLGDIFKLKDFVNVVNISTLAKYIKKEWEESREELLR